MVQLSLSKTYKYAIIYAIIFLMFIIAFASQPYFTAESSTVNVNMFFTNLTIKDNEGKEKLDIINSQKSDLYLILILSIIIFICFGCSFLTLFLNAKKLNKFFNIITLLAMIFIIIIFHISIYNNTSQFSKIIYDMTGGQNTKIQTTDTPGYVLTLACTILMFITTVSSFIF
jgi:hypothetical protein